MYLIHSGYFLPNTFKMPEGYESESEFIAPSKRKVGGGGFQSMGKFEN